MVGSLALHFEVRVRPDKRNGRTDRGKAIQRRGECLFLKGHRASEPAS